LAVVIFSARWVVRRHALPPTSSIRLAVGGAALGLLLVAEFTVVRWLRGLTLDEYFANRPDVVALAALARRVTTAVGSPGYRWTASRRL
jgi:hypothetical protein